MKRDLSIALAAILLVAGIAFAIDRAIPDKPLTPSQPFTEKVKAAVKAAPKSGKTVMHVNGEAVTEAEFNAFLQSVPEEQRAFLASSPQGKRLLANEIVKLKMLAQEADRLGLSSDPALRSQIDMVHAQLLAGRALEQLAKPKVDAYVRQEFEREKNGTIERRHIAVAYSGGQIPARDGSARTVEQATQKASAIAARLRGGADFEELARAESDDQRTAMNGGSFGPQPREALPPEVAKLQPGQISDPVRTPLAVHIFRVAQLSLDEMRPTLERRAQQRAMQETIAELEKKSKVEFDPVFFPPAQQSPAPPQRGTLPGPR